MTTRKQLPRVVGVGNKVKLAIGKRVVVTLLNNAATTPPFRATLNAVNDFMKTYSAFHRGAGPHANITYGKVQEAIATIRKFVNASPKHALLFTQNTSAAINLFARLLNLKSTDTVITSSIEHTSNNLPWHYNTKARVVEIETFSNGAIDEKDLEHKVSKYGKSLKLITMTGASNQTGYIPDMKKLSRLAHRHGALLFIDAAQLAPHRKIDLQKDGIDALALSAHKIYAPYGVGLLVLPKKILDRIPVDPGGGSIDMISDNSIVWAPADVRHQTGTWAVAGIVALAESCKTIMKAGWANIVRHERELLKYVLDKLDEIPGLTLYVSKKDYIRGKRIGTIPFNLEGYHHALLAAILENEYGIETRAGTICNHKLVRSWFDVSNKEQKAIEKKIAKGNRLASYGIVRASIGIHNTKRDIDTLISALKSISEKGAHLKYKPVPEEEIYVPVGRS